MAERGIGDYAGKGTVGGAVSFLAFTVPTEWLGVLPPVPDGYLVPMIGAGGVVVTAALASAGYRGKKTGEP